MAPLTGGHTPSRRKAFPAPWRKQANGLAGAGHHGSCPALTQHNEPAPIPDSLGAMMVAGYNNWDRIRQLKEQWQADHTEDMFGEGSAREFQSHVVPNNELYQDRFILLRDRAAEQVALNRTALECRRLELWLHSMESAHSFCNSRSFKITCPGTLRDRD